MTESKEDLSFADRIRANYEKVILEQGTGIKDRFKTIIEDVSNRGASGLQVWNDRTLSDEIRVNSTRSRYHGLCVKVYIDPVVVDFKQLAGCKMRVSASMFGITNGLQVLSFGTGENMKKDELLQIGDLEAHKYYRFEGAKVDFEMTIGTGLSIGKVYYVVGFSPSKQVIFLTDKDSEHAIFNINYDSERKKFTEAESF